MVDREALANAYSRRQQTAVQEWTAYLAAYGAKYGEALRDYHDVYDRQRNRDEAKVAFVVLVLSVVGGTAIAATLGKEGIKGVFRERALRIAREKGVTKVLKAAGMTQGRATAEFVAGAIEKNLTSALSQEIKDQLNAAFPDVGASVLSTANVQQFFQDFGALNSLAGRGGRTAEFIVRADRRLIDDDKAVAMFDGLERSQLMCSPSASVLERVLNADTAKRIELTLYLKDILSRDYLVETSLNRLQTHSDRYRENARTPVRTSPSSRNWDMGRSVADGPMHHLDYMHVEDMGRLVKERADVLYNRFLGSRPFGSGPLNRVDLQAAERGLVDLAESAPLNLFDPIVGR